MAGKNRRSTSDIANLINDSIIENASKFSFFQILRLLHLAIKTSKDSSTEKNEQVSIRITPSLDLSFPPSDVK